MARCSSCGRFYIWKTGAPFNRAMVAQGPTVQTEFPEGRCRECRGPTETDTLVYVGDDDLFQGLTV